MWGSYKEERKKLGFSYVCKGFSSYANRMINLHGIVIFRLHVHLKKYTWCQRNLTTWYVYIYMYIHRLGIREFSSSPGWVYGFIVINHEYWWSRVLSGGFVKSLHFMQDCRGAARAVGCGGRITCGQTSSAVGSLEKKIKWLCISTVY